MRGSNTVGHHAISLVNMLTINKLTIILMHPVLILKVTIEVINSDELDVASYRLASNARGFTNTMVLVQLVLLLR